MRTHTHVLHTHSSGLTDVVSLPLTCWSTWRITLSIRHTRCYYCPHSLKVACGSCLLHIYGFALKVKMCCVCSFSWCPFDWFVTHSLTQVCSLFLFAGLRDAVRWVSHALCWLLCDRIHHDQNHNSVLSLFCYICKANQLIWSYLLDMRFGRLVTFLNHYKVCLLRISIDKNNSKFEDLDFDVHTY